MAPRDTHKSGGEIKALLIKEINELGIDNALKAKILKNVKKLPEGAITADQQRELKNAFLIVSVIRELDKKDSKMADEAIKGGQVMIEDGGDLYKLLTDLSESRISSHHKKDKTAPDRSFQAGEIFRECLFGKTDGKTWLQLEAHSTGGKNPIEALINVLAHLMDYVVHKVTGKNVGQYGISEHLDANPIKISPEITKALKAVEPGRSHSKTSNLPVPITKHTPPQGGAGQRSI
jgi:hypothetical protein